MKISLTPADRIGPADPVAGGAIRWAQFAVYGVVVPFTVTALAASGWYVATGQTPLDVLAGLASVPKIEMTMPPRPGPEKPAASLIRPPATDPQVKMTMGPMPAEPPPSAEKPKTETAPPATQATTAAPPAPPAAPAPSAGALPTLSLPSVTPPGLATAEAPKAPPAPPAMSEPAIPPSGESLTPPSFAQLPARTDVKALPTAPSNDLLRNSAYGPLPVAAGGKEPRTAYARPFAGDKSQPHVAVVVTGLGLSKEATEAAINKLPSDVSLSFSPYAGNLDTWIKKARNGGHEVLLDLPLEPPNFPTHDAGPLAVLTQNSPAEAVNRLDAVLGKAAGYVGVAGGLRSPVAAKEQWTPLLHELKNRGLLFVGDGLVGVPEGNVPAAVSVTLVGDETPFRAAIDARLSRLLLAAQRDGTAVAYVSARPVTFERLLAWFETLPQKGATLAPLSAVVRPPS